MFYKDHVFKICTIMMPCYFFPFDNREFLEDIERFYNSFGFAVCKEWMGVNILPISSTRIPNIITNKFNIFLFKRVSRPEDSVSWISTFFIRYVLELVAQGVDVGLNDTLINFYTNPLMDGARPWRGPREKDEYFFSCLIMALTTAEDLVIDVAAATGMNFTCINCWSSSLLLILKRYAVSIYGHVHNLYGFHQVH